MEWRTTNASVTCTASDTGVGLRNPSDASFKISTPIADGEENSNATAGPRQVCDLADNCTDAVATGARIDRKAPTVTLAPTSGASVVAGSILTLTYACADGGSGVATCGGDVPSGTTLPTSTIGTHTVIVATTDTVGNGGTTTFSYTVTAAPVDPDPEPEPPVDPPTDPGPINPGPTLGGDLVEEHLTYLRGEEYLSVPAGQTLTRTVGCGGVLTDASAVLLHVDQGSSYRDVHVASAVRSGGGAMTFTVVNDTDGQAQLKLLATCLRPTTGAGGRVSVAATPTSAVEPGSTVDVACPAGSRGVAPSWSIADGMLTRATPSADGARWSFAATGTGTVGVACLRTTTAPGAMLVFDSTSGQVGGGEQPGSTTVSAPDRFSVLTAGWTAGAGAVYLGHELQDRQAVLGAAHGDATVTLLTVRGYTRALTATAPRIARLARGRTRVTTVVACHAPTCHGTLRLDGTRAGRTVRLGTVTLTRATTSTVRATFVVPRRLRALTRGRLVVSLGRHHVVIKR